MFYHENLVNFDKKKPRRAYVSIGVYSNSANTLLLEKVTKLFRCCSGIIVSRRIRNMPTASIVKGRGYLNHNDRTIKQVNSRSWKPELSSRNIVYVNEPIQNVYHELFDPALENYNQSQIKKNHPERQIKDYYEHISRSKQEKPFYEYIVAFGNINDKNTEIYPVLQQCLDEYNRGFQSRNPNFRVIQQITHRDEIGIDHTHIDIVPVCSGNTRGLSVKNSFRGALKEMGYTGKTAFLDWRQSEEKYMAEILERHGLEFERGSGRDEHLNARQYQAEAREINRLAQQKLENMDLPSIPEPEIQVNRFTKKEYVKLSVDEFDQIKQVIDYQQTQITSLEAQKSDLSDKLKNVELKLDTARKKPYMRENECLRAKLEKNKSKIDKFDEVSIQNQQLKEQINTLNDLQVENNNLKLDLKKEKQRSENFKIIGKLYQCMYLYLMDHILPRFINIDWISNRINSLFKNVLNDYQKESTNPDIRTQLFYDNIELNDSYSNVDQQFSNLPDIDEVIENSELDQENEYEYY